MSFKSQNKPPKTRNFKRFYFRNSGGLFSQFWWRATGEKGAEQFTRHVSLIFSKRRGIHDLLHDEKLRI